MVLGCPLKLRGRLVLDVTAQEYARLATAQEGLTYEAVCVLKKQDSTFYKSIMKEYMAKDYLRLLSVVMLLALSCAFVACDDDEDSLNSIQQEVMDKLAGTWIRETIYDSSGYPILFACREVTFTKNGTITVKYINGDNSVKYALNPKTTIDTGTYTVSEDGNTIKSSVWCKLGNEYKGTFYISSLSGSTISIEGVTYKRESSGSQSWDDSSGAGSGNGSDSGSNNGEAPGFRDFSWTYTNTSVTVQYLTSENNTIKATIYYGTTTSPSKSVSTTISGGHIISAKITGLTKATKYYVKCVATNEYGTTTSDVMQVMTGSN